MKKILALILALAMVLAVVACTPAEPVQDQDPSAEATQAPATEPDAQEPAAEPTVLTVYTWWDVTKFEHLQMMETEFEEANQDIELEFVTIPSKYADTMVTKLAAGEIPDVMMLAMDQVPRYALNDMLYPLDELASQEYLDALYPVVKNALTVNGTLYAAARDGDAEGHVPEHEDVRGRGH